MQFLWEVREYEPTYKQEKENKEGREGIKENEQWTG